MKMLIAKKVFLSLNFFTTQICMLLILTWYNIRNIIFENIYLKFKKELKYLNKQLLLENFTLFS